MDSTAAWLGGVSVRLNVIRSLLFFCYVCNADC